MLFDLCSTANIWLVYFYFQFRILKQIGVKNDIIIFVFNYILVLWDKVYPIQVTVPPMGGNGRLLR